MLPVRKKEGKQMKKLIIAGVVLLLAVLGLIVFTGNDSPLAKKPTTEEAPAPSATETPLDGEPEEAEEVENVTVDYAAIYALHDPDEIVMTVNGKEIPWKDYFYFYYSEASQMDNQFAMYQSYGYDLGWNSQADEDGRTYADMLGEFAEDSLRQFLTMEELAEQNQVVLSEEKEAELQQNHEENIAYFCGEEGTEEDFYAYLDSIYLSPELYWRLIRANVLYEETFRQLYGEDGADLPEEDVLAWMEDNGIVSANHILIGTMDLSTGEELEEAVVAEKTALAQEIAQELQAIEDTEERIARFLELKEQYCEDGGDYVFGPGVMVQEFYDGALALEENEVSDPIQSQYGFHIILRRPLNADDEIYSSGGANNTGRVSAANELFGKKLQEVEDAQVISYADGFTAPSIKDFLSVSTETA